MQSIYHCILRSQDNIRLDNDGGQPLKRFLTSNQLSHVIRSHTCDPLLSDQFKENQKLISLYSAVKFTEENQAPTKTMALSTFALIAHSAIRMIRLDSSNITPSIPKTKETTGDKTQQLKTNATTSKRTIKQTAVPTLPNDKLPNN